MKTVYYNVCKRRFQSDSGGSLPVYLDDIHPRLESKFWDDLESEYPDYDFTIEDDGSVSLINPKGDLITLVIISV